MMRMMMRVYYICWILIPLLFFRIHIPLRYICVHKYGRSYTFIISVDYLLYGTVLFL